MIQSFLLNENKKKLNLNFFQLTFKVIKWLIILFFIVTTFFGCGQQIFNSSLSPISHPGSGFEIIINHMYNPNNHSVVNNGAGEYQYRFITTGNFHDAIKLGPFFGLFVWPLACFTAIISQSLSGYNVSYHYGEGFHIILTILFIVIIVRSFLFFFSLKQFKQQIIIQQIQPEIAKIRNKYKDSKDIQSKQLMQKEIFDLNKSHNVNPIEAILSTFITLPFFYAMYRIFTSLRLFKNDWIINSKYKLIYTTWNAIIHEHYWIYLLFFFILLPIQIISMKLPTWLLKIKNKDQNLTKETLSQQRKNGWMINIMVIVMVVFSLVIPLSVNFYWIFSGLYTITQTLVLNKFNSKSSDKNKSQQKIKSLEKKKIKMTKNLNLLKKQQFNFYYY